MSETSAQEPTMEEILASIRRIISEDDGAHPAPAAAPEPAHHDDDILELTEKVEPPRAPEPPPREPESVGDLDVFARPEPARAAPPRPEPPRAEPPRPMPAPSYEPAFGEPTSDAGLVSPQAAERAAAHFGALAQSIAMPAPGVTLDAVVRELLKPLLREWLDQHLTGIVEGAVQAEVERIARQRR